MEKTITQLYDSLRRTHIITTIENGSRDEPQVLLSFFSARTNDYIYIQTSCNLTTGVTKNHSENFHETDDVFLGCRCVFFLRFISILLTRNGLETVSRFFSRVLPTLFRQQLLLITMRNYTSCWQTRGWGGFFSILSFYIYIKLCIAAGNDRFQKRRFEQRHNTSATLPPFFHLWAAPPKSRDGRNTHGKKKRSCYFFLFPLLFLFI